jgi:cytoskeletal protein RodZ
MNSSIGEQLRKAREQKRLTIEQAAFATHIKPDYLRALEADDRELLPSMVQAKGFLRLYAGHLNLDVQPLLDQWEGIIPQQVTTSPIQVVDEINISVETRQHIFPQETQLEESISDTSTSVDQLNESFELHEVSQQEFLSNSLKAADWHFQQLGKKLKERREILHLQFKDIEKFIHVREYYLKALEEGRIDDIPSRVQCQGMLSNYAKFLGLDIDEILLEFADGLQARHQGMIAKENKEVPPHAKTLHKPAGKWSRFLSADLLISGSVILILLGFAIWAAINVSRYRKAETVDTPVSISEILLNTEEITATPFETEIMQTNISTTHPEDGSVVVPITTQVVESTQQGNEGSPIQVSIIARQRAWLKVTADGKEVFNGRITPGNAYPFYATKSLELVTGDASSIQIIFNEQDLGILGDTGEVMQLTFDISGIITPTIAPLPTSTNTPAVTSTPTLEPTPIFTPTVTPYIP